MSKLSELKRATLEDFPGAPEWFEQFLEFQNSFNEDVHGRINGGLGLDNLNWALTEPVSCVHGQEVVVRNPLWQKKLRCIGMHAVKSDGLPVLGSPTWRNISRPSSPLQIGLTALFQPPHGEIALRASANQTLTTSVTAAVAWDIQDLLDGEISHSTTSNNSQISFKSAGRVLAVHDVVFTSNATGERLAYQIRNAAASAADPRRAQNRLGAHGVDEHTGSAFWTVAAGDFLQVAAFQSSGGNLDLQNNNAQECLFGARYVAPPDGYSANVTFLVLGA